MPGLPPDLTVVVIAYNDVGRLSTAVGSVLGQTMRNLEVVIVDDASTDGTGELAERLERESPGIVRLIRLPENSGGCGRPRNVGVQHARGAFVMFLDSDDTLDRHACLTMFLTASRTGADVVSGLCVRVSAAGEVPWYPRLYGAYAEYGSLTEFPNLIYDTLSTNKCYRRGFLLESRLEFPEGIVFEDIYFSAKAYLSAAKIVLVPHRVYNWHMNQGGARRSLSDRRHEIAHFTDRLQIHRMVDDLMTGSELKLKKDIKFLNHDLRLYVAEYSLRNPAYQEAFRAAAREYLKTLDPRVFGRANRMCAAAAFLLLRDDHEGIHAASDYLGADERITAELTEADGRIFWGSRHLDRPAGRRMLEVTSLGFHERGPGELAVGARITEWTTSTVRGSVSDPLGRIAEAGTIHATMEIAPRHGPGGIRVPAIVRPSGHGLDWSAHLPSQRALLVRGLGRGRPLRFGIRLVVAGKELYCPAVTPQDLAALPGLVVRPLSRLLTSHRLSAVATSREGHVRGGDLAFDVVPGSAPGRLAGKIVSGLARVGGLAAFVLRAARAGAGRVLRAWNGRPLKRFVCHTVFSRLPVRAGLAVFEAHMGKQFGDNPRYVYEYLKTSGAGIRAVWSYADRPDGFPREARLVKRDSWAYYLALSRAQYWIDNQGFPLVAKKRAQTTYLQTWHGSAFKHMGLDEPSVQLAPRAARERLADSVRRFDCFVVRSDHDLQTLVPGLGVRAALLKTGYPRNDALITGGDPRILAGLRESLGLADGRRVVLYAPTYRADAQGRTAAFRPTFDLKRFADAVGERFVLLVRAHYLHDRFNVGTPCGSVVDVSHIDDLTSLMLISDALITDYSSVMFDYALLDRPMFFHTPDLDDYVHRHRGAYLDLAEEAPGPVTRDEESLFDAVNHIDGAAAQFRSQRRAFAERYGEYDTGNAAKAIADHLLGGRRG